MTNKVSNWMWWVAVCCFSLGLVATVVAPAWAQQASPAGGFTWSQVALMVGVGAAWGDIRRQVTDLRRDMDDIRKEVKK